MINDRGTLGKRVASPADHQDQEAIVIAGKQQQTVPRMRTHVHKYASMQVHKYISIRVQANGSQNEDTSSKYASMQVHKYISLKVQANG